MKARPSTPSAGPPEASTAWGGEVLVGDLGLEDRLLGGGRGVGHDPGDERPGPSRRGVGQAEGHQLGPEPAGQRNRGTVIGQLRVAGDPAQHAEQARRQGRHPIRHCHGVYRNGYLRYCPGCGRTEPLPRHGGALRRRARPPRRAAHPHDPRVPDHGAAPLARAARPRRHLPGRAPAAVAADRPAAGPRLLARRHPRPPDQLDRRRRAHRHPRPLARRARPPRRTRHPRHPRPAHPPPPPARPRPSRRPPRRRRHRPLRTRPLLRPQPLAPAAHRRRPRHRLHARPPSCRC